MQQRQIICYWAWQTEIYITNFLDRLSFILVTKYDFWENTNKKLKTKLFVYQGNQICKRAEDEKNNEEQLSPFISQRENDIKEIDEKGMSFAKLNYKRNLIFSKSKLYF